MHEALTLQKRKSCKIVPALALHRADNSICGLTGASYSPPSPLDLRYSDNASTVFADRPIRPLPNRRIRSRLSAEAANSILYPPEASPSDIQSLSLSHGDGALPNGFASRGTHIDSMAADNPAIQGRVVDEMHSYQFRGNEDGIEAHRTPGGDRPYTESYNRLPPFGSASTKNGYIVSRNDTTKYIQPSIPHSTASSGDSVDGYDSFENTNNKKKRKIPISGTLGHSSTLSADMASMGISTTRDIDVLPGDQDSGVGHYYGSGSSAVPAGSSGTGISGAGRGRYGRAVARRHSGRSPLGVSFNGSNTLQNGRPPYSRKEIALKGAIGGEGSDLPNLQSCRSDSRTEAAPTNTSDQGIISAAIAHAAALPTPLAKGQENVSLLEKESHKRAGSPRTQFTFSCEPLSGKSMIWPGHETVSPASSKHMNRTGSAVSQVGQLQKDVSTQGTQTSPHMPSPVSQAASKQTSNNQQASQQPRKPRRPLVKQYTMAARERRLRQDYNNYHHPPREEDVWVCEFCEYESIFGSPPEALIRQYEIKDRRDRRRLAEKQRLLEKAKMKGRKGKKGNKNAKNVNTAVHPNPKSRPDQPPLDQAPFGNQGTESDDYVHNDMGESLPELPPHIPSKIPQPVSHNQNHSYRPPGGSRANGTAVRGP